MNPLIVVELLKQVGNFGGSFRKEAIGVGTIAPALISILTTYNETSSLTSVSTDQWSFLIGSVIAMAVHLNAKRKENSTE